MFEVSWISKQNRKIGEEKGYEYNSLTWVFKKSSRRKKQDLMIQPQD